MRKEGGWVWRNVIMPKNLSLIAIERWISFKLQPNFHFCFSFQGEFFLVENLLQFVGTVKLRIIWMKFLNYRFELHAKSMGCDVDSLMPLSWSTSLLNHYPVSLFGNYLVSSCPNFENFVKVAIDFTREYMYVVCDFKSAFCRIW